MQGHAWCTAGRTVQRVAHDRVPQCQHVHPKLVGAACHRVQRYQGGVACRVIGLHLPLCFGRLTRHHVYFLPGALRPIGHQRQGDGARFGVQLAVNGSDVAFVDVAVLEQGGHAFLHDWAERKHHQSAGRLVKAVYHQRLGKYRLYPVDQAILLVRTAPWHSQQPCWFVDDQQVVVLVNRPVGIWLWLRCAERKGAGKERGHSAVLCSLGWCPFLQKANLQVNQRTLQILIAGGGIGGLAAALACHRAGCAVQVLEQAPAFAEVGAGLQLGPNAVRVLEQWGLGPAVRAVAAIPQRLQVRDAASGHVLGQMPLGTAFRQRYGSDYLTLHRADLQQLLLTAVQATGCSGVQLQLQTTVKSIAEEADQISATDHNGMKYTAHALLGCDGLWSGVRQHLLHDGRPLPTGHLAYRAMLAADDVPSAMAQDQVTVWLGPRMHVVAYPVRGGALFNLVVIVHGNLSVDAAPSGHQGWNHPTTAKNVLERLSGAHSVLHNLITSAAEWRCWVLHDRDPLQGPRQMAQGRIALLGDAAHPMRPYLAQGAAMALEDAQAVAHALMSVQGNAAADDALPQALQTYAAARWQRNARVQATARRNGQIFHARGPLRTARNVAMAILGERLLDTHWLYAGGMGGEG